MSIRMRLEHAKETGSETPVDSFPITQHHDRATDPVTHGNDQLDETSDRAEWCAQTCIERLRVRTSFQPLQDQV
jgi:hypothetical protein